MSKQTGKNYYKERYTLDDESEHLVSEGQVDLLEQMYNGELYMRFISGTEKLSMQALSRRGYVDIHASGKCSLTKKGAALSEHLVSRREPEVFEDDDSYLLWGEEG